MPPEPSLENRDVAANLAAVRRMIDRTCLDAGRDPAGVELVAVTKTFPADVIRAAYDSGQRIFGESRLQEAKPKIDVLPEDIHWHFIGRVQRNKLRKILGAFKVVHGIDSMALASAADRIAGEEGRRSAVFLQVNIAAESSKGGFHPDELILNFPRLAALSNLDVLGLMAIPPPSESGSETRQWFAAVRELRDRIGREHGVHLPGLSMGMSGDFEAAILEGATLVRVGSAIFGNR